MTKFQFRTDSVNFAPMVTPMLFSLNHRTFRCLGLAGPLVLFSLNSSAGPTRQSHTFVSSSSRNRRPCTRARTPLRRRHSCVVPPPPLTRRLLATPSRRRARALHCAAARARPHLFRAAAPQSPARPHRACTTCAPLTTRPPPSKSYAATCSASTHTPTLVQPPLLRLSLPRSSIQD